MVAALASGCLLTTSLGDLSSGSAADTLADGGGTDTSSGGSDVVTTPDGPPGPLVDGAPVDATDVDAVGGPTGFCNGKTTSICEDFDREPLDSGWLTEVNGGGSCFAERRANVSATSAPKALVARCSSSAPGETEGHAVIHRVVGQLTNSITLSCMVRVDEIQGSLYSNGMSVVVRGGGKTIYAQLGYEAAGPSNVRLVVEKFGGDNGTDVVSTIPRGAWRRVDLKVEAPDATHGHVIVTEGASSSTLDVMTSVWPPAGSRQLDVSLGVFYSETPGTTIAYDDCTIDLK